MRCDSVKRKESDCVGMFVETFKVESPYVEYGEDFIHASYDYDSTDVVYNDDGSVSVRPLSEKVEFKTARKVPKLGYVPSALILASQEERYRQGLYRLSLTPAKPASGPGTAWELSTALSGTRHTLLIVQLLGMACCGHCVLCCHWLTSASRQFHTVRIV